MPQINDNSKQYIVDALIKLMEYRDFDEIPVSEIAKKAGIARATFYRYFSSKDEILNYYFQNKRDNFTKDIAFVPSNEIEYYQVLLKALSVLKTNMATLKTIAKSHKGYLYLEYLNELITTEAKERKEFVNPLLSYVYAGAYYNLTIHWINHNCEDSIETLADALFIASYSFEKYIELKDKLHELTKDL